MHKTAKPIKYFVMNLQLTSEVNEITEKKETVTMCYVKRIEKKWFLNLKWRPNRFISIPSTSHSC